MPQFSQAGRDAYVLDGFYQILYICVHHIPLQPERKIATAHFGLLEDLLEAE
jgi:hypothetical protein